MINLAMINSLSVTTRKLELNSIKWARRDLNPRPLGYEPFKTGTMKFSEIDKEDFWKYLIEERKVSIKWAKAVVRVIDLESLRKAFYDCTNKKDFVLAVRDLIHYLVDRRKMDRLTALDILEARFLKPNKVKEKGNLSQGFRNC